ncbi:hypothetical protein ElyMa_002210700 [Elysia marginata]|uniref:G-protein coupled receptors family 1 profile domain-containing protein n=1 Tax=Elysia marginata TaxID=1093978 RepID=A0AAV4FVN3_9GAST|nr:hypothetical protein ElyMa_002210700 [Elysia marginata]
MAFSFYSYKWWTHGLLLYTDNSVLCTVIAASETAMRALTLFDHLLLLYLPSLVFLLFDIGLVTCACCFNKRNWAKPRVDKYLTSADSQCCQSEQGKLKVQTWTTTRVIVQTANSHVKGMTSCWAGYHVRLRQSLTPDDVYWRRRAEVLSMVVFNAVIYQVFVSPKAISMCHAWLQGGLANNEVEKAAGDIATDRILQFTFYLFFVINPSIPFLVSRKFRRNAFMLMSRRCSKSLDMASLRPASPL